MEKIEKVFDSKWGVVLFYSLIAVVTFAIAHSTVNVTNTKIGDNNIKISESVYA